MQELGYFKPMKMAKPSDRINIVTPNKNAIKKVKRAKDIDDVMNLPNFGSSSSSDEYMAHLKKKSYKNDYK